MGRSSEEAVAESDGLAVEEGAPRASARIHAGGEEAPDAVRLDEAAAASIRSHRRMLERISTACPSCHLGRAKSRGFLATDAKNRVPGERTLTHAAPGVRAKAGRSNQADRCSEGRSHEEHADRCDRCHARLRADWTRDATGPRAALRLYGRWRFVVRHRRHGCVSNQKGHLGCSSKIGKAFAKAVKSVITCHSKQATMRFKGSSENGAGTSEENCEENPGTRPRASSMTR